MATNDSQPPESDRQGTGDTEESFEPLPDTPESRRARKWLFRAIWVLVLVNVSVFTWVVLSGLLRGKH